jgi:protein CMS1
MGGGGDDLGDDDFDFDNTPLSRFVAGEQSDDDGDNDNDGNDETTTSSSASEAIKETTTKSKKRKNEDGTDKEREGQNKNNANLAPGQKGQEQKQPKKKKIRGHSDVLMEAGKNIAKESTAMQAAFLFAMYSSTHKNIGSESSEVDFKFEESHFLEGGGKGDDKFANFLSKTLPMKRLRKWNTAISPLVLVISSGARRSVEVLKKVSSLKLRTAKLFAKHLNVEDQRKMMAENTYGIAVGTPNRLEKLVQEGALSLAATEFIIIDMLEDSKGFSVCTLKDTQTDLCKFLTLAKDRLNDDMKIALY